MESDRVHTLRREDSAVTTKPNGQVATASACADAATWSPRGPDHTGDASPEIARL